MKKMPDLIYNEKVKWSNYIAKWSDNGVDQECSYAKAKFEIGFDKCFELISGKIEIMEEICLKFSEVNHSLLKEINDLKYKSTPRPICEAPTNKNILIRCHYEDSENTMWVEGYKNNEFQEMFFTKCGRIIVNPIEWIELPKKGEE